jgi:CubicO group peptidase (beta-lactamase class C family)
MIRKPTLLLLLSLTSASLFAQDANQQQIIGQVENGLRPNAEVIFADSTQQFNLLERMDYYGVPSVSIAVIHQGRLAWAKAYGSAVDAPKRTADENTLYQAASLSKSINAFCILKLAQEGKLDLNKDVRTYLKTWTFPDNDFSKGKTITLKSLLSHTAGLGVRGFMGYPKGDLLPTLNEILDGKRPANNEAVRPVMAPGIQSQYSGGGVVITKKVLLDNVTSDYGALLKETVLVPLKMPSSTFEQPLPSRYQNFAAAYDNNRKETAGQYYVYPEQAPDGLWTTPSDFARFILSVQQSLKGSGNVLSQAMAQEMLSPVLAGSDAALGTFITEKGGEKYFFHTGANVGYRSKYYGGFTTGDGVVIMTNSDNDQILDEIVNSVAVAYHWKDFYRPEVRKLVVLPDSLADRYVGQYHSDSPDLTITVRKKNGELELAVHGNFERLYFVSNTAFFLKSDVHTFAEFLSSDQGRTYDLQVKQGDKLLFTAHRQ